MNKTVIAFVGHMGSGKGAAAKYLAEKYGASTYRFSSILRDIMRRLYVPEERENITKTSQMVRSAFGEDILARVMAHDVSGDSSSVVVVDGVRRVADLDGIKDMSGFVLVHIFADEDVRLRRMNARGENPDDATKTKEELAKNRTLETEVTIDEVIPFATVTIDNNGTEAELYAKLDELVNTYAGRH